VMQGSMHSGPGSSQSAIGSPAAPAARISTSQVAPLQEHNEVVRGPRASSPRLKRSRVSFHSVSTTIFSNSDGAIKHVADEEKMLSPLADGSSLSDDRTDAKPLGTEYPQQEDSTMEVFPSLQDMIASPACGTQRRDSLTGDLAPMQREMRRSFGDTRTSMSEDIHRVLTDDAEASAGEDDVEDNTGSRGQVAALVALAEEDEAAAAAATAPPLAARPLEEAAGGDASASALSASVMASAAMLDVGQSPAGGIAAAFEHFSAADPVFHDADPVFCDRAASEENMVGGVVEASGPAGLPPAGAAAATQLAGPPFVTPEKHRGGSCASSMPMSIIGSSSDGSSSDALRSMAESGRDATIDDMNLTELIREDERAVPQLDLEGEFNAVGGASTNVRESSMVRVSTSNLSSSNKLPARSPQPQWNPYHNFADPGTPAVEDDASALAIDPASTADWPANAASPQPVEIDSVYRPDPASPMERLPVMHGQSAMVCLLGSDSDLCASSHPPIGDTAEARSPETIDMGGIRDAIRTSNHCVDLLGDDSDLPEARKSFDACVPTYCDSKATASSMLFHGPTVPAVQPEVLSGALSSARRTMIDECPSSAATSSELPGSQRASAPLFPAPPATDFEERNRKFEECNGLGDVQLEPDASLCSSSGRAPHGNSGSVSAGVPLMHGAGLGRSHVAGLPQIAKVNEASQVRKYPTAFGSNGPSTQSMRTSSAISHASAFDEDVCMDYSFTGSFSAPLPCQSEWQNVDNNPICQKRFSWEDFLSHCGITLPPVEVQGGEPILHARAAMLAPGGLHAPQGVDALISKRIEELGTKNANTKRVYDDEVQQWDQSTSMPTSAVELLGALEAPHELQEVRNRLAARFSHCKNEAQLCWYGMKREWLRQDLEIQRQSVRINQQHLDSFNGSIHELASISASVRAMIRRANCPTDLQQECQDFQDMAVEQLDEMQETNRTCQHSVAREKSEFDRQRQTTLQIERQLEEQKRLLQRDKVRMQKLRDDLQQTKYRRMMLDKSRYAQLCLITQDDHSAISLLLRGGFRAKVERSNAFSGVRIVIEPPGPLPAASGAEFLRTRVPPNLGWELLVGLFCRALARLEARGMCDGKASLTPGRRRSSDEVLEVTVHIDDVQRVVHHLGMVAVAVEEQLYVLRNLPKQLVEISGLSASVVGDLEGDSAVDCGLRLEVDLTLQVIRSHDIVFDSSDPCAEGRAIPRNRDADPSYVDAVECMVKFDADIAAFPHVNLSNARLEPRFGRFDVRTVEQELARARGSGAAARAAPGSPAQRLVGALQAAVEALRNPASSDAVTHYPPSWVSVCC